MSEPRLDGDRTEVRPAPDDYVEFARAGVRAKGEFECTACGHRIVTRNALPQCARCGGSLWERSSWTPFAHFLARVDSQQLL